MTDAAVRAIRAKIAATVSARQRRDILVRLGCFTGGDGESRRVLVRPSQASTAEGVELLTAIHALDCACLNGAPGEIKRAGDRLVDLWDKARLAYQ